MDLLICAMIAPMPKPSKPRFVVHAAWKGHVKCNCAFCGISFSTHWDYTKWRVECPRCHRNYIVAPTFYYFDEPTRLCGTRPVLPPMDLLAPNDTMPRVPLKPYNVGRKVVNVQRFKTRMNKG